MFLDGGGLYGTEDAVNFVVRQGEVTRVDGPYAEGKEVVGGWAILQYDTLEEAVADRREFAELHAKYWPEVTVISTLRQISTGPEAPGDCSAQSRSSEAVGEGVLDGLGDRCLDLCVEVVLVVEVRQQGAQVEVLDGAGEDVVGLQRCVDHRVGKARIRVFRKSLRSAESSASSTSSDAGGSDPSSFICVHRRQQALAQGVDLGRRSGCRGRRARA